MEKEFDEMFGGMFGKKKEESAGLQSIRDAIDACQRTIEFCEKILKGRKTKKKKQL